MDRQKEAQECYQSALNMDKNSFFPNYNMGVLLSHELSKVDDALSFFNKALNQAKQAQERDHEINVLNNIALLHEAVQNYTDAIEAMN